MIVQRTLFRIMVLSTLSVFSMTVRGQSETTNLVDLPALGQALEFVGTGQAGFVAPVCCNNFRGQFRVAGRNDIIVQLE